MERSRLLLLLLLQTAVAHSICKRHIRKWNLLYTDLDGTGLAFREINSPGNKQTDRQAGRQAGRHAHTHAGSPGVTGLAWLLETETVTGTTNTRMHLHPPMKNPSLSSSPNCDSLVPSSNALAGLTVDLAAVLEFCLRLPAIATPLRYI